MVDLLPQREMHLENEMMIRVKGSKRKRGSLRKTLEERL